MPRHLLKMNEVCILDGIARNTAGIVPVFDEVLAHRPVMFVGVGRSPWEMEKALRLLLDPPGRPSQAQMWGFHRTDGQLDLGGEPLVFIRRCSWFCAGTAMKAFWRIWPGGQVAVVTPSPYWKAFQILESCQGESGHDGLVGTANGPLGTAAPAAEHDTAWHLDPAPLVQAMQEVFDELSAYSGDCDHPFRVNVTTCSGA